MNIYDCTTFYSEKMMLNLRFNILNKNVHKFIVVESSFSHSGEKKNFNFNIEDYPQFKEKIIYLKIENEPIGLYKDVEKLKKPFYKRLNSIKRIEQSYDYMMRGIKDAHDEDLIIISDNDEIPNLNSNKFKKNNKKFIIFKQLLFYYKFNLFHELMPWFGSKACKKKKLSSPQWLRNVKSKDYPNWRFDLFFSKKKYTNNYYVENGGWHFTNIRTPIELEKKLLKFAHHFEYEQSGLNIEDLRKMMKERKVVYDHSVDQKGYKWSGNFQLEKIKKSLLPAYVYNNEEKYKDWLD